MVRKYINHIVCLILVLSISLGQEIIIGANESYDNIAPILNSITIENYSKVTNKSKIKVNVDIEEEGLGVKQLGIHFRGKNYGKVFTLTYSAGELDSDGNYNELLFSGQNPITFDLKEHNLVKDDYYIYYVTIVDANDNGYYSAMDGSESWTKDSTMYFSVISSTITDVSSPNIKSFIIPNSANIQWGKSYDIEVELEDESGIAEIILNYVDENNNEISFIYSTQHGYKLKKGKHTLTFFDGTNCDVKGTYRLVNIHCVDIYDNWCNISINDTNKDKFTSYVTITKLRNEGIVQPIIVSAEICEKEITAPNVIDLKMEVKTQNADIEGISVTMINTNGRAYNLNMELENKLKTGVHHIKIPISPYFESGEYSITDINLYSDYGFTFYFNTDKPYGSYAEHYELNTILNDNTINIKCLDQVSYYGSTSNTKTAVKKIKQLKSGQIAVLDYNFNNIAKKTIFEAIAGKNITVVFQSDDLQWVFNGKDVKKKWCKDINLETEISRAKGIYYGFAKDKYVLKVKFASNGQLPGKAQIRVNTSYLSAKYKIDEDLILSYMDKSPEVLDKNVKIMEDGFAEIEIEHNSTYILSDKMPRLISPSKFKAKRKSSTSIKLTWNKVYRADGYVIYRADSKKGKYKKIKIIKRYKTVKFVDKKLKKGKRYYYKLKAMSNRKGIKSVYSNTVSAKTK